MPLGACGIKHSVVGHSPPMSHANVILNDMVNLGRPQSLSQPARLIRREAGIHSSTAHIHTPLDRRNVAVRAVNRVGRKTPPMEARCGGHAVGIGGRCREGPSTTHAVTHNPDPIPGSSLRQCTNECC